MPAPIMEKISAAFGDAMKDASVVKQLVKLGATAVTDTPVEFKKCISDDRAKWQKLAKEAKIVAQ
jgi:tripartite-type tricarboxylate transporter receptor subunit TctC